MLTRREWLANASLVAAGLALGSNSRAAALQPASGRRKPNLLFFFPDQMRRHAMGFVGGDPVYTPNLDRFAREGTYLPQATATFPVCTPWRGMMMTGRFPHATGVINNCNSARPNVYLRREEECFTDVLHSEGYHIGYIGKWHLTAPQKPYLPQDPDHDDGLAWDEFTPPEERHHIDHWYGYNAYDDHMRPRYWSTEAKREGYHNVDQWGPEHETDKAIEYLENRGSKLRDPNKPFALWMSLNPPHPPYHKVPARYREPYQGKTWRELLRRGNVRLEGSGANAEKAVLDYFAGVTGIDEQFGRMLETLERLHLTDDTIVVFTSDHGDMMGSQGLMGKRVPYEESFNVPMILRWPGRIAAGRSDDLLIGTPDLMPTLLGLMGCKTAIPRQVQGVDYSGLLLETDRVPRPHSAFYLDSPEAGDHRGVRTHTHTFILPKEPTNKFPVLLFDNVADPYQLHNLASEKPQLVAELTADLHAWLERIGDPWRSTALAAK